MTATEILLHRQTRLRDTERFASEECVDKLQQVIRQRRLDVITDPAGSRVVFTAPHTLELLRDGCAAHAREPYTGSLAKRFAAACGGACVTWTETERLRVGKLGEPDGSNRDPNFLTDIELAHSSWFASLRALRDGMAPATPQPDSCGPSSTVACVPVAVHVDVHGIRDQPAYAVDCLIGTSALRRCFGDERAHAICCRIEEHLRPVRAPSPLIPFYTGTSGSPVHIDAVSFSINAS